MVSGNFKVWFDFEVSIIQNAYAPSTSRAYTAWWWVFADWCKARNLNPRLCPLQSILDFLQGLFDNGHAASTFGVFSAMSMAGHNSLDCFTARSHLLVKHFPVGPLLNTLFLSGTFKWC